MKRARIPPMTKGRIKAVRALIGALGSTGKAAHKAMDKANDRYGPFSDQYAEEKARYEEACDLLKRLYRLLDYRREELEHPFRT